MADQVEEASFTDAPRVSIAWLSRPKSGETECGDAVIVRRVGETLLIGVIDVLGHGPKAAQIARTSVECLGATQLSNVNTVLNELYGALEGSRGAAALLLLITATTMEVCSVGNVALRSTSGKVPFVLTPGVLGLRLRQPRVNSCPLFSDRIVLFTDGISGRFDLLTLRSKTPSEAVTYIFESHRHFHDDATVVVLDVR